MSKVKKVHIVGGDHTVREMFKKHGWEDVPYIEDCDLVQFTGGEDVSPSFYQEQKHPMTSSNFLRDDYESGMFELALDNEKPCAGICRGAQFLHVMSGGRLWQHVNNHAIKHYHKINFHTPFLQGRRPMFANSTHHQMMRTPWSEEVKKDMVVISTANLSTQKETVGFSRKGKTYTDLEIVYHKVGKGVLCFQPHPEYFTSISAPLPALYFELIHHYLKP